MGEHVGRSSARWLLAFQCAALSLAALFFALLPPDKGPVLLVSLHGQSALQLARSKMTLLGKGRFRGSFVVMGARPSFMGALVNHGVLVLPALPVLCGSASSLES